MSRRAVLKEWIRTGCERRDMNYGRAVRRYADARNVTTQQLTNDDLFGLWQLVQRVPVPDNG